MVCSGRLYAANKPLDVWAAERGGQSEAVVRSLLIIQAKTVKNIEPQAVHLDGTERQRETAATDGTNCPEQCG